MRSPDSNQQHFFSYLSPDSRVPYEAAGLKSAVSLVGGYLMDDPLWDSSSSSQNRERWLNTKAQRPFFQSIRNQAKAAGLLSDEHFSVDRTLLEACASMKSIKSKDGSWPSDAGSGKNTEVGFRTNVFLKGYFFNNRLNTR